MNEYRIVTIKDAFEKVPLESIDAFLKDLGQMMRHHRELESALSELTKTEIRTKLDNGFIWIDDGKNDIEFRLEVGT